MQKDNERLLNKRLIRKLARTSHTKGNEKLLNERLRRIVKRMIISYKR